MERVVGVGVDVVAIERVRRLITRRPRAVERLFSDEERRYCGSLSSPWESWASSFAAKEAVMKAMRSSPSKTPWRSVWVDRTPTGPRVVLAGRAREFARALGVERIELSLAHDAGVAVAVAVAIGTSEGARSDYGDASS